MEHHEKMRLQPHSFMNDLFHFYVLFYFMVNKEVSIDTPPGEYVVGWWWKPTIMSNPSVDHF